MNFSKIEVEMVDGSFVPVDFSKELGNIMWTQGNDVAICECGREIYHAKDVTLTDAQKEFIKNQAQKFPYMYRIALEKAIEADKVEA